MNNAPVFYKKNGWAIVKIARELINKEEGDRFLPVYQYAETYGTGRGTIQYAIKFLEDNGCMTVTKQGPKGSHIASLNRNLLWEFSDWGTLLCAIPGVVDSTIAGLATGLYLTLRQTPFPFNLVQITHSKNRLAELAKNRYHCVLTTRLAAELAQLAYPLLEIVAELHQGVYLEPYQIYGRGQSLENGMKMAIICQSYEQAFFCEKLTAGKEVEIIKMPHQEAVKALAEAKIDFLVARPMMVDFTDPAIHGTGLAQLGLDKDGATPVIVANRENYEMVPFLRKWLQAPEICRIQKEVMNGERDMMFY